MKDEAAIREAVRQREAGITDAEFLKGTIAEVPLPFVRARKPA